MTIPSYPYRIAALAAAVATLVGALVLLADEPTTYTAQPTPSPTWTVESAEGDAGPVAPPRSGAAVAVAEDVEASAETRSEDAELAADGQDAASEPAEDSTQVAEPNSIELCPATAIGDQSVVDSGALVLYITEPTNVIAGHEHLGWSYLDEVPTGTLIEVTCGPASGTYVAESHDWLDEQGGYMPVAWNSAGLVLQTCSDGGTGATLARRVS